MTAIVSLGLLLLCSGACSVQFGRRIEKYIPLCCIGVIAFLFPWYCLNQLKVGTVVLLVIMAAWIIAAALRLTRGGQNLLTPGLCVFILLCVLFWLLSRNKLVGLWDELRLWGAFPKAMHFSQKLQIGTQVETFVIMQSYPPGMPLFIYYLTCFQAFFNESVAFFGYAVLGASLFLPVLEGLRWKDYPKYMPIVAIILLLPCLFYSNGEDYAYYYNSLFIDPTLGLAVGYALYLSACGDFRDSYIVLSFSLSLFLLLLLKDTGMVFAVLSVVLALFNIRANRVKPRWLSLTPAAMLPFAARGAWALVLASNGIHAHVGLSFASIPWGSAPSLVNALWTSPILKAPGVSLSFAVCFLLLALSDYFLTKRRRDISLTVWLYTFLAFSLACCVFGFGYFCIYGTTLASFNRYVGTLLTGYAGYLVCRILPMFCTSDKLPVILPKARGWIKAFGNAVLCLGIGLLLCVFCLVWNGNKASWGGYAAAQSTADSILTAVEEDRASAERTNRVFLVMQSDNLDNPRMHHRIYFNLIGSNVNIVNFFNETEYPSGVIETADEWREIVVGYDCDYVYFMGGNGTIPHDLQLNFLPVVSTHNALYRVNAQSNELILEPVSALQQEGTR